MRQPATAELLTLTGTRALQLSHEAFDAMPPSRGLEHLREMLVSHRMMPDRGDRHLARFERWLRPTAADAARHPNDRDPDRTVRPMASPAAPTRKRQPDTQYGQRHPLRQTRDHRSG
jgi:hypothetical protein